MDTVTREYENLKWPKGIRDKTHIAMLAILVLVTGIYFISTSVLIAKDGVLYIEIAKKIVDNPVEVVYGTGQAPGYPFLIYLMHKAISLFYSTQSLHGWIISAQVVSLLSKLLATIVLYFIGSYFVGSRFSFWGVLVLSVLPDSVDYGSDALTDWPSILFLAMGILLLLLGVQYRKSSIFGCAGAAAGLGYLVRPECGQVVLYGILWLLFNLVRPQSKMKRTKAARALILLLAGFAVIAVPYMKSMGHVFPEQHILRLPASLSMNSDNLCIAGLSAADLMRSQTLIINVCETLMYYFIPSLLMGLYAYFRTQSKRAERTFFAAAFIIINVTMLIVWQQLYNGPLSRRYTLPLIALTVFYIPSGLHKITCWLSSKTFRGNLNTEKNTQRLFFILMAAGIGICAAKLVRMSPLRWEKQGYRDAAEWLSKNTDPAALIAVQDRRISFYAEREGMVYNEDIPFGADYVVRLVRQGDKNYPSYSLNSLTGLLASWLMDEDSGMNIIDSSGNNNSAWICGSAKHESGYSGNGLRLNGIDGCVSAKLNVSETACGVSLWFRTNSGNGGLFCVSWGEFGADGSDRHVYLKDGNLCARIWSNETISTTGLNLNDGRWHHVVYTYGKQINGQRLYIDGQLCASGTKSQSDFIYQDRIYIGYSNDSAPSFLDGCIDEVQVSNQVLRGDGQPEMKIEYREEYITGVNRREKNKSLVIFKVVR